MICEEPKKKRDILFRQANHRRMRKIFQRNGGAAMSCNAVGAPWHERSRIEKVAAACANAILRNDRIKSSIFGGQGRTSSMCNFGIRSRIFAFAFT